MISKNFNKVLNTIRITNLLKLTRIDSNLYSNSSFTFNKNSLFTFAAGKKQGDKKGQIKMEKQKIEKEYDGLSEEDLKEKYIERANSLLKKMQDKFAEIQVVKQNPKILDSVQINNQGKRHKLSEVATITVRGANLLVVTPFDEGMRDIINKGIEASKLDVQIVIEGNSLLVTLGNIPNDVKKELQASINKIYNTIKDTIKENRHSFLSEMKKLEKILGKDDVKRLEKNVLDQVEKINKQMDSLYKKKEEEIKNC